MNKIKSFKTSFKKMDETVNAWLSSNPGIEVIKITYAPLFHVNDVDIYFVQIHYNDSPKTL